MVSGSTASELTRLSNSVVIPKANKPRGAGFASFEAPAWASSLPSIHESHHSSSIEICAIQFTLRTWLDGGQVVVARGSDLRHIIALFNAVDVARIQGIFLSARRSNQ